MGKLNKYLTLLLLTTALAFILRIPSTFSQPEPRSLLYEDFDSAERIGVFFGGCKIVSIEGDRVVNITDLTGAVGYPGNALNPDEGTIVFWWMPPPDMFKFYTADRPEWKEFTYGGKTYKPPKGGYLLDQISWFPAEPGTFQLSLEFVDEDTAVLRWAVWDGRKWHAARWVHDPSYWEAGSWYMIAVTYGPKGLVLYVDSEMRARNPDYTGGVNTRLPFFLGQTQIEMEGYGKYWPYGPHSMMGCYDQLQVINRQMHYVRFELDIPEKIEVGEIEISGQLSEPATITVTLINPNGEVKTYDFKSDEDGKYSFTLNLDMEGEWKLIISTYLPKALTFARGFYVLNVVEPESLIPIPLDTTTLMIVAAVVAIALIVFAVSRRGRKTVPPAPPPPPPPPPPPYASP